MWMACVERKEKGHLEEGGEERGGGQLVRLEAAERDPRLEAAEDFLHHLLVVGEGTEESVYVVEHLTRAPLHVVDLGFALLIEDGHSLAVHLHGEHAENVEEHVFVAGGSNVLDGETHDIGQVAPSEEERCDIQTNLVAKRSTILLVLLSDGEEHREELLRLFRRQFVEVIADLVAESVCTEKDVGVAGFLQKLCCDCPCDLLFLEVLKPHVCRLLHGRIHRIVK